MGSSAREQFKVIIKNKARFPPSAPRFSIGELLALRSIGLKCSLRRDALSLPAGIPVLGRRESEAFGCRSPPVPHKESVSRENKPAEEGGESQKERQHRGTGQSPGAPLAGNPPPRASDFVPSD